MDIAWLRLDRPSCIYTPINAQIARLTHFILTTTIMEYIPFSATSSLWIDNQWHNITQSSAIKVQLRHLERRYTAKGINNHVESTNGKRVFFLQKTLTCWSHLLTLASEGRASTNHLDSLCVGIKVVCISRDLDETIGHLLHLAHGS